MRENFLAQIGDDVPGCLRCVWPRIILQQNHSPSFTAGKRFFFFLKSVTQSNQLLVTLRSDSSTGFEQLVVNDTLLVPPNTRQQFVCMNIWFCSAGRWLNRINPRFSTFGIVIEYPLLIAGHFLYKESFFLNPNSRDIAVSRRLPLFSRLSTCGTQRPSF